MATGRKTYGGRNTHTHTSFSLGGSQSREPGFCSSGGNWNQKFSLFLFVLVEISSEERNSILTRPVGLVLSQSVERTLLKVGRMVGRRAGSSVGVGSWRGLSHHAQWAMHRASDPLPLKYGWSTDISHSFMRNRPGPRAFQRPVAARPPARPKLQVTMFLTLLLKLFSPPANNVAAMITFNVEPGLASVLLPSFTASWNMRPRGTSKLQTSLFSAACQGGPWLISLLAYRCLDLRVYWFSLFLPDIFLRHYPQIPHDRLHPCVSCYIITVTV